MRFSKFENDRYFNGKLGLTNEERIERILSEYTDAELADFSYHTIEKLTGRLSQTIRTRHQHNEMPLREAVIVDKIPEQYHHKTRGKKMVSVKEVAKRYGITYHSLSSATRRKPEEKIEVLAKQIYNRQMKKVEMNAQCG